MIEWNESMKTGVNKIDQQHKKLFQKFNEFDQAFAGTADRDAAGKALDFLQFYASWHFEEEEKVMDEKQCPAAGKNKAEHEVFRKKFGRFYKEWQDGTMTPELAATVYAELEDWLVNHVLKIDSQLQNV